MDHLVCDLDGTLIEEDLERDFLRFLSSRKLLTKRSMVVAVLLTPINLLRKYRELGSIWKVWRVGITDSELARFMDDFFNTYRYTIRDEVVQILQRHQGPRILLTGSYEPLVLRWLKMSGLNIYFDTVCGCSLREGSIRTLRHPYGKEKLWLMQDKTLAMGIGNEFADRFLLKKCETAVTVGSCNRLKNALASHPKHKETYVRP